MIQPIPEPKMARAAAHPMTRRLSHRDRLLCFAVLASLLPGVAAAQTEASPAPPIGPDLSVPSPPPKLPPGASGTERRASGGVLVIAVGTGQLVQLPGPATSVVAADPRVARIQPLSPTSLFVVGIAAGRTTLLATNEAGAPVAQFEVNVRGGPEAAVVDSKQTAAQVQTTLRRSLRGAANVTVFGSPAGLVLSGKVHNAAEAEQVVALTRSLSSDKQPVVNNLAVEGAIQVNVRVRIAEISRNISRELGFNWSVLANLSGAAIGLQTASAVGALAQGGGQIVFNGGGRNFDINSLIDALAQDQLISLLAEPNLTALSGETASFLVGGEFPIPIASSGGSINTITVQFKQYGISLAFTPTVLSDDRVNMKIRPEVSELSNVGAVTLPGATAGSPAIPALIVRRAETTLEMASGQSFAIAGLLQRNTSQNDTGTAWLSDIPVLGALFRSESFQRNETELVIIVTPYVVRPPAQQSLVRAPTDGFRAATDLDRILYQRQIARTGTAHTQAPLNAGFILE